MSILGKWKIYTVTTFDPEVGPKPLTYDEIMALPEDDPNAEMKEFAAAILEITEEALKVWLPIPEEQRAEAAEEGVFVNDDGYACIQEQPVKVENGEYFYDSGEEGEIMGEQIDPWKKIELDENGRFAFNPLMVYEKI